MDKRTVLALVLSFIVLFGWTYIIAPMFAPPSQQPIPGKQTQNIPDVIDESLLSSSQIPNTTSDNVTANQILDNNLSLALSSPEELITENTDLMEVTFNTATGDIRSVSLNNWTDKDGATITFNKNNNNDYAKILMPFNGSYSKEIQENENGKIITFTSQNNNLVLTKSYELSNNDYFIKTTIDVTNIGNSSLNIPLQINIGPKLGDGFDDNSYVFEGAIITDGNKTYRVAIKDSDRKSLQNAVWAGYTSKYFLFAAVSNNLFKKADIIPVNNFPVATIGTDFIINPGDRNRVAFDFYVGPKYYSQLKSYNMSLQKSMDYGWFYFIAIPMLYILNFVYGIFHNYGIAIIVLTIIVKLLTLPLTLKSMISMKEMSKIQPKVLELREKYKNDPTKLNQATMDLYKEHNVNPLSGCLPLFLQIPIFFALYKTLLLSLELKGAPFFGWIVDLSAKDPYYITPIIMGITMFIQQKMTPSTADPMQQKIFLFMPIVFTFLFINFQSGLVLYWLTNNVLSIIQQCILNKKKS